MQNFYHTKHICKIWIFMQWVDMSFKNGISTKVFSQELHLKGLIFSCTVVKCVFLSQVSHSWIRRNGEMSYLLNNNPTMMLMWINLTKNPMNPMIAKPMAVATAIFWNSEISTRNWDIIQFSLWDFRIITRK